MQNAQHYLKAAHTGTTQTTYTLPTDWGQGRAGFGGLIAGMMIAAMRRDVPIERVLLSLSCTFIGPVLLNQPFSIQTNILRNGKNTLQMQARIIQDDGKGNTTPTLMFASFGILRESKVVMPALPAPTVTMQEDMPSLTFIPKLMPNFSQHVDIRWVFGGLPFFGKGTREMGGWWRWNDMADVELIPELSEAHYVALTDAWPPAVLPLISEPAPTSTMTWTLHFAQPVAEFSNDWQLYRATIDHAHSGYGQTQAHIWNKQGQLIAVSNQLVAVFDS